MPASEIASKFINENIVPLVGIFVGMALIGGGILLYKEGYFEPASKIEIINTETPAEVKAEEEKDIIVEVAGAVVKPGVYKLKEGSRIEDLLIMAGGISADANRDWFEKSINRAAKILDGQKLYIYKNGEDFVNQSNAMTAKTSGGIKLDQGGVAGVASGLVNINTASLSELDTLPGIGQVYGQSIIDHRPYSSIDELVSRGAIKEGVLEKIRDRVSIN